jgi:hypothetical protein
MLLAGQRIRVRLDGILMHIIDEAGQLRRTLRCPVPLTACGRIRDARPASAPPPRPPPLPQNGSCRSMAPFRSPANASKSVGVHARKLVSVSLDEHTVTVYDADTPIKAVPRRSTTNLNRTRAKHQITSST